MNRASIVIASFFLVSPLVGIAQGTTQSASLISPMSPREARDLIKSAHSAEQYKQVAGYFHRQEAEYRAKAADEKTERDRRAAVNAGLYQKYPRPVDSAQNLYDSYVADANAAALQAQRYDQLAAGQSQLDKQMATGPQSK
jgi:hypothetical protein